MFHTTRWTYRTSSCTHKQTNDKAEHRGMYDDTSTLQKDFKEKNTAEPQTKIPNNTENDSSVLSHLRGQHAEKPHQVLGAAIINSVVVAPVRLRLQVVLSGVPAHRGAVVGVGGEQGPGVRGPREASSVNVLLRDGLADDQPCHRVGALQAAAVSIRSSRVVEE